MLECLPDGDLVNKTNEEFKAAFTAWLDVSETTAPEEPYDQMKQYCAEAEPNTDAEEQCPVGCNVWTMFV